MRAEVTKEGSIVLVADSTAEGRVLDTFVRQPITKAGLFEGDFGALVIEISKSTKEETLNPQTVTRHEVYEIAKEVAKQEIQNYMKRCLYGDGTYFVDGGK